MNILHYLVSQFSARTTGCDSGKKDAGFFIALRERSESRKTLWLKKI